ncbi:hypothetical protein CaCOL14_003056 [Colletotrichum acutatum]|uniref:2EXR domain-containing protein n=1 Tax=Glomerella acutata TaxID=27357 RepID=A0AAD8ULY9_GLOAC|nr:uncharacterized protein BDZ83DRAFT_752971 [Colletotrichum acutatum]KAK1723983.1 hypothetical protein BDZ83DRAFT_752971 [Colletotrichum acutatum]
MSFPQFKKLPPEIRRKIWVEALPAPQIYEPDSHEGNWYSDKGTRFFHEYYYTRVREACKEAYEACMSFGRFTFGCFGNSNIRGLWYNDARDAIYYATLGQWHGTNLKASRKMIISVEIALDEFLKTGFEDEKFAACRHLVVALFIDRYLPIGSIMTDDLARMEPLLRAMKDDANIAQTASCSGIIANRFPELAGKDYLTWAEVRGMLLKTREERILANAGKPKMYKRPLLLEAVEVFKNENAQDPERIF